MKIREHKVYWGLKNSAFAKFKGFKRAQQFTQKDFDKLMVDSGHDEKVTLLIENYLISLRGVRDQKEPNDFITESKEEWSEFVMNQYIYLCKNIDAYSSENKDEIPFIYDYRKFLHFISKIKNQKDTAISQHLKERFMIRLQFNLPPFEEFQSRYKDLLEDNLGGTETKGLLKEKEKISRALIEQLFRLK